MENGSERGGSISLGMEIFWQSSYVITNAVTHPYAVNQGFPPTLFSEWLTKKPA